MLSVVLFVIDQISKIFITKLFSVESFGYWTTFDGQSSIVVINPILKIQRIDNPALAFGIDPGVFGVLINPLTILLTILIIYYLYGSLIKKENKIKSFSLILILGGAFGNLFDRLIHGKVVDFINIGITDTIRWNYIFNLADTFITIGMIMILFSDFLLNKKKENEQSLS